MTAINIDKDPSCRDDFDPKSLSADAALAQIKAGVSRVRGIEKIAIREALNRILAEDIRSRINVPTGTNSAMDGYALNSADIPSDGTAELNVLGTAWAGKPFAEKVTPGSCVRIMTGAIMPEGTDTVIIQEDVQVTGSGIRIDGSTRKGDNVRQAGEDIAAGGDDTDRRPAPEPRRYRPGSLARHCRGERGAAAAGRVFFHRR